MIAQPAFWSRERVREVFQQAWAAGAVLKVEFVKRKDGSLRTMTCSKVPAVQLRAGARNDLGAAQADTMFVWDQEKQKPASVPIEAILSVEYVGGTNGAK